MPRIRVVTDSACDIPDTLLKQFDITVVPFSVRWGEDVQVDRGGALTQHQLERIIDRAQPRPEVFSPSVDEFNRVYRSMRDTCDGVISIQTSSKLSDTFANAATAREAYGLVGHGGPFPISVVDSWSLSMGLGWLVLMVARAAQAGVELAKLTSMVTRLRGQTHVAFITDNSEMLPGITRVSGPRSQFNGISSLKPLFHIDEGHIAVYERTRTRVKARDSLYNFVEDFPRIGEMAVFHVDAANDLDHLLTRIGAIYPRERIVVFQPGLATSCWFGPNALGVAVFEGEDM